MHVGGILLEVTNLTPIFPSISQGSVIDIVIPWNQLTEPKGSETFQFFLFALSFFRFHSEPKAILSSHWRDVVLRLAFRSPAFAGIGSDTCRGTHRLGKPVTPNGHAEARD